MINLDDLDFEDDIKLDKYNLDTEAEKQAQLYDKYGSIWSEAESDAEEAKARLELTKAELYAQVMKEWEDLGMAKRPSDAGAEYWIIQQQSYRDALEHYHKENRVSKRLKIAKTALEMKKKSIEVESQLYCAGFWAKPEFNNKTSETITEMKREDRNKKTQEKVRESMKKRKRESMKD